MRTDENRIHTFDNLRAIIALIGIPFHAALFLYVASLMRAGYYSPDSHFTLPLIYSAHNIIFMLIFFIHTFRMPLFFLLAGFFSHLLIERKGVGYFIKNRLLRIGLPFVFFIFIMLPVSLSPLFLIAEQTRQSVSQVIALKYHAGSLWQYLNTTWSYWFLYDLLLFYFFLIILLMLRRCFVAFKINHTIFLMQTRWIYLFLSLGAVLFLMWGKNWYAPLHESFKPVISVLLFYAIWYCAGWFFWKKKALLAQLALMPWRKLLFSFLLYLAYLVLYSFSINAKHESMYLLTITCYCFSMVFAVFACFGMIDRYFSGYRPILRYFVGASYWIYLVQIPILFLLIPITIAVIASVYLQLIVASLLCLFMSLLTYHLFVRHTWLQLIVG